MPNADKRMVPAWDLIGHEGSFRLVGGRRIYEAVMYDMATARSDRVRLAYLVADEKGLRQVNRYVGPDALVEVIEDFDAPPVDDVDEAVSDAPPAAPTD